MLGKKFGLLTPTERINKKGAAKYLCKCDCGKTVTARAAFLLDGSIVSCGCKKREDVKDLSKKHFHKARKKLEKTKVEDTLLVALTQKLSKNSSTGVKGVSLIQSGKLAGKYRADICFKKKRKYLGTFSTLSEAKKAREEAEKELYEPILEKYKDVLDEVKK